MKVPRIMIAAVSSGSGKTFLTCSLLQALVDLEKKVAAFKCGPDYIDPMFHQKVIGVPSKNLDTYFTGENVTKYLLLEGAKEKNISIIEGAMGLYDGLGGIKEEASSYHLAKVTKTPIILVIDGHGMGRSVIPLISGFLQYDRSQLICGVILNNITGMFYETLKPELEAQIPVPVLGYFPKQKDIHLESRHLGLQMPHEIADLKKQVKKSADIIKTTVSIDKIMALALQAVDLEAEEVLITPEEKNIRIGVARDEAFCFYYEDNLKLLQKFGAELIYFSPLRDSKLPDHVHGILLGGGYPELYAKELSENNQMKASVKEAIDNGMPSIAECGGFMYLHETMEDMEERAYSMVGAVRGRCHYTGKLVRFGYINIMEGKGNFLSKNTGIRGHEFHYYDSTVNGTSCIAQKPVSGKEWQCIHAAKSHWWGFPHLYYYSNPGYVKYYLERALEYGKVL
ncbi:cobyrinate a,c-diamide synthase [Anaerocolumna sp.]|uniref:cobyrinate a,c-diamide synthase n=1 Tax=Anaerocolumna sp. TaxID=2041569 RepID=UPI0028B02E0B|nr:cobyrinate a,c-diamide synthase [Anaerocolumna sp.]